MVGGGAGGRHIVDIHRRAVGDGARVDGGERQAAAPGEADERAVDGEAVEDEPIGDGGVDRPADPAARGEGDERQAGALGVADMGDAGEQALRVAVGENVLERLFDDEGDGVRLARAERPAGWRRAGVAELPRRLADLGEQRRLDQMRPVEGV